MNLETRVGFKGASVLRGLIKEHIIECTVDGLYTGDLRFLDSYVKLTKYLGVEP